VRAYEDPVNGSSRGIFFVEYLPSVSLESVRAALKETLHQCPVVLLHLTSTKWDRSGRLPDLPVPASVEPTIIGLAALPVGSVTPTTLMSGYGPEGYMIRSGPLLSLPNTVLQPDALEQWRKRQRT
jgi:hypothetical protein